MAYTKTTWEDGENKYSITDQNGNVIPGFEDIKLLYTGTGGTPLSQEKMNNIEDGLAGVIAESYKTNAEQNIQLWELEAQVIQDKENMGGWQGEGFFNYQNELAALSNVLITRGTKSSDGFVTFGTTNMDTPIVSSLPSLSPAGGKSVTFSYDDKYMAFAQSSGDFLSIYKRVGDTFSRLPAPATPPASMSNGVAFSPDGNYLAVAHYSSPYITIYKRDGDVFTKLPNPGTLPPNVCYGVAWSPDGVYLVAVHSDNSPFFTVYKRSGDTFTKLANPSSLPTAGSGSGCAVFSSDGSLLVIGNNSNNLIVYKRVGDVFTKLTVTAPTSTVTSLSWSPDGVHLAATHSLSPFITIYKRNGDTLTKLSNPSTLPQAGLCATYSPDGLYLVVGNVATSYIFFYKRSGDTYTANFPPVLTHNLQMYGIAFSMDGTYLVGALPAGSPYIAIYKRSGYFKTATSGSLTLKRKTLPEVSNSVFILDEVALDTGVSRTYDISLDGGVTWEEVTTAGEVVTLGHSGTELIIKLKFTRSVSGVGEGKVYWVAAWAGVV